MLALTANSRATLAYAARARARVPQCREHLRTQRTQKGAGDTRACVPGTRARAPAPTERNASHARCPNAGNICARSARKWVPGTHARACRGHARVPQHPPSAMRATRDPSPTVHRPVCGSFSFKSHFPAGARASGSYKYQVPQENTSKSMKHLATFRNLTLISGTYHGKCRK